MAGTKLVVALLSTALLAVLIAVYMRDTFDAESLRGKRVVICGASTGIGEELAYQYARLGAQVLLVARREEQLKKVVSRCGDIGAQTANYVVADLSSLEDVKHLVAEAKKLFGGPDVLILNHVMTYYKFWNENSDLSKVPSYFAVNTISYINIATLFLPDLQRMNGSIVVVSSVTGVMGLPRVAPYSANKHALHGFFDSMRQDLMLQGHRQVSITLCVLGSIDTNNAKKVTKGTPVDRNLKRQAVDECALAIVKGAALRLRQVYFPGFVSFIETIHFFFPNFVESLVHVATKEKPMEDFWKW